MAKMNKQEQASGFMSQRRQVLNDNTQFAIKEAYKSLRTNINFSLLGKDCKKFCITSGNTGEGKSITMLNLAISIAQTGKKVLLIDADMRRPALARLLLEQATPGLSELLIGEAKLEDAVHKNVYPNLDVLLSGEVPPNPSELLSSERMQQLIQESEKDYDYILVDVPPVGLVTDACIVANLLDGVVLLAWQNRSQRDVLAKAVKSLNLAGANILGYVLNGMVPQSKRYYKYHYDKY